MAPGLRKLLESDRCSHTWEAEAEDQRFKTSLGNVMRLCQKRQRIKEKRRKEKVGMKEDHM